MKKIALIPFLLLCLLNARGQYMSFFGDSTWEYHMVVLNQLPEDYINYPPEITSPLNVYCRTIVSRYDKNEYSNYPPGYICNTDHSDSLVWYECARLYEDTVYGRLYSRDYLICDMSLSEGDTFRYVSTGVWTGIPPTMLVDSVKYIAGRKIIYLSLLNYQNDYFFGSEYASQHADYPFSIIFIEGIGPTYGTGQQNDLPLSPSAIDGRLRLALLLCMYKDDSLVYLANEDLGCIQTCWDPLEHWGVTEHPQQSMNLYPNPASSYIVLDMGTGEEMDGDVIISDMMGRVCLQQHIAGLSNRISVAGLPPGMYFLTYIHEQRIITRKFIKE